MKEEKEALQGSQLTNATRRRFLQAGAAVGGLTLLGRNGEVSAASPAIELPMVNGKRQLATYPQKRELIIMTERPVQLETPFHIFNEGAFTPNDAFFVRWHLADMPTSIDEGTFRINVHGLVNVPLKLNLTDLKILFESVEIAAVCQCSGNSRGFFNPRVPGGQWGNGAMGNAVWKGVRLRDILLKAGIADEARLVKFNGADGPALPATPDYIKTLNIDMAMSEDVIVAYSMNGKPLPLLNGFPVRLVVPGWYATYWVKMLNDIEVVGRREKNFWMNPAYRIPDNDCACMEPGQTGVTTTPITRMNVRSFITSLADGSTIKGGHTYEVKGIAFDGGNGIARILFSSDGGGTWTQAQLGEDLGEYSFREWSSTFSPKSGNQYRLVCMAINNIGESQRIEPRWNPSGYMRNVVETITVNAT